MRQAGLALCAWPAGRTVPVGGRTATVGGVELHEALAELACLLGTWQGEGEGGYPTVESFRYRETATFEHVGKPRISYRNATENASTGLPLHAESGFLRGAGPGRAEFVLAYGSGIVDVEEGEVTVHPDGVALHLRTTGIARTATAKEVLTHRAPHHRGGRHAALPGGDGGGGPAAPAPPGGRPDATRGRRPQSAPPRVRPQTRR